MKIEQKLYDSPKSNFRFVKRQVQIERGNVQFIEYLTEEVLVLQERRITDWSEDGHTMVGYKWFDVEVVEEGE